MEFKASDILTTDFKTLDYLENIEKAHYLFGKKRFLVVLKENLYFGLLTPLDISTNKKNLIGDCLTKKPGIHYKQTLTDIIEILLFQGFRVLPCFNEDDDFYGVITIENTLEAVCKNFVSENKQNKWENLSLHELTHYTRNPVQLIFSAVNLLKDSALDDQQLSMVQEVEKATIQINTIISKFVLKYFHSQ